MSPSPKLAADEVIQLEVPAERAGQRADKALVAMLAELGQPATRAEVQRWIAEGRVLLDGEQILKKTALEAGALVEIDPARPLPSDARPDPTVRFEVVFEDEHLLVVDKPAGLVVHPGAGNRDATLANGLRHHAPALGALPRSGLLHRLDKDTSGLLLVAKTLPALTHLTRALQERHITREYRAIVNGVMTAGGAVDAPVGK